MSSLAADREVSPRFRYGMTAIWSFLLIQGASAGESVEAFTEPYRTAVIIPSQTGTLETLDAKVGQRVAAGQSLGALDCEVLRVQRKITLAKAEATGELEAAQAELKVKQSLYERYQALRQESNEASELEVERKRADVEIQRARVRSVEDNLSLHRLEGELLEAQIRQRTLVSPIDGVVVAVDAEQGDFVAPGQAKSVVTLVDIKRLRATFHLSAREAVSLTAGDILSLEVIDQSQPISGQVEFVSPVTDARTGTTQVRVTIENSSYSVRSGTRCRYRSRTASAAVLNQPVDSPK